MVLVVALWPGVAGAHDADELFRVHVYTRFAPAEDRIDLRYVMDMAEIQSFNDLERLDADGDGEIAAAEHQPYLQLKAAEIAGGLQLEIDGQPVALGFASGELLVQTSVYGTPLLRVDVWLSTVEPLDLIAGTHAVRFVDRNVTDARGVREIVVTPDAGIEYEAAPSLLHEVTSVLTALEPGAAPPRVTEAEFSFAFVVEETPPPAAPTEPAAPAAPADSGVLAVEEQAGDADPVGDGVEVGDPQGEAAAPAVVGPEPPAVAGDSTADVEVPRPALEREAPAVAEAPVEGADPAGVASSEARPEPTADRPAAMLLDDADLADSGVAGALTSGGGDSDEADAAQLVTTTEAGVAALMVAMMLATGFGALHALEPGHGKTLVAAYFVGTRGTVGQAFTLGAVIASSHTVGVLVIVALLQLGAGLFVPEVVLPMFGLASGVAVIVIGLLVLRDGLRDGKRGGLLPGHWHLPGRGHAHSPGHSHDHEHRHGHAHAADHHHDESHDHDRGIATEADARSTDAGEGERPPWRRLFALGIVDGFVPTPSTIVMLLAAISLGKLVFGVLLVAAFGLGFGAVLGAIALAMVLGRRWIGQRSGSRSARLERLGRMAAVAGPFVASAALIASGVFLAARAVLTA